MKIDFNIIKNVVKDWALKDWENVVNDDGVFEVFNRYGGVDYVLSKEEYFSSLEKVTNFNELEGWYNLIMGEDLGDGFGNWLDNILSL